MTFPLPCPPLPPGFDEKEGKILKRAWLQMCHEALDYKGGAGRSGEVHPGIKIHRGVVRAASTSRTMDVNEDER